MKETMLHAYLFVRPGWLCREMLAPTVLSIVVSLV
mgnify:CR=1 FL=1